MSTIHERAMLVSLNISQWTARRYDKRVSKQATDSNNAAQDAGRFNKALLPKEALKRVTKAVTAVRTFHSEHTLPWGDSGSRLLPASEYLSYVESIGVFRGEFDAAVQEFILKYPKYVNDASVSLKSMFNTNDYPPTCDIPHKFNISMHVTPVPQEADFRIDLGNAEVDKIRQDIRTRTETASRQATESLWNRLREVVQNMATRLENKDSTFKNSLVENISTVVGLLPALNITDDPALESIRREVETTLCDMHPDSIRNNESARLNKAQQAKDIMDKMSQFMGAPV